MNELFKIKFDLTMEDIIEFAQYHYDHSPKVKKTIWRYRILLPLLMASFLVMVNSRMFSIAPNIVDWACAACIALFGFFFIPPGMKRSAVKNTGKMYSEGKNRDLLGTHDLSISDDGITETTENCKSEYTWKALEKISGTDRHLYLYVSSVSAMILPLRTLNDEAEKLALAEFLKEKMK
jgi:hypothetical protein